MGKKIILIQSHCDTEKKINILKDNIDKLLLLNVDILLFTHIDLPAEIVSKVKYYILDRTNPILWEERRHFCWWVNNDVKLETTVPDYGWTVFNQIIKGYNLIKDEDYDSFFIVCYDLNIDDLVKEVINNEIYGKFKHIKPKNVVFNTALIFLSLNKYQFEKIINNLKKEEYINNQKLVAETYLEFLIDKCNLNLTNLGDVTDLIHEHSKVFNDSKNNNYEIFIDTKHKLKFRYIKKKYDKSHYLIINDDVIEIKDNYFIFNEEIKHIENFGVLIDGQYDDLKSIFNIKKINNLTIK